MEWLSKKFLIKTLKMYFDIEDESKIGVQFKLLNIFGKHSVVCQNLKLKPQVVNTKDMIVHVESCKIDYLQIAVDSSRQQLLSAKVKGAHIFLKFNKNIQREPTNKTLYKPQIQQFKRVISSQETYEQLKYFQGSPFKKMLIEQVLRKTNLLIQNVDICLYYSQGPNAKCFGITLGELNVCQRLIINRSKNGQNQKEEQIECKMKGIGLYLGISGTENDSMVGQNFRKQVVRERQTSVRKRYFLQKNQLVLYFNQGNNTLTVLSELLELNLSAFYIRQFLQIVNQIKPLLSKEPKIRPGQGKMLTSGPYTFSQGTAEWWKYIGMNLVEKIKEKQKLNIVKNRQYRLYLYCLLYCYAYGAQSTYLSYIENAQKYKKAKQVLNSHKFILQKIYKIQNKQLEPSEELQLRGFVSFLSMKPKKKEQKGRFMNFKNNIWGELTKLTSEKSLDYHDVKKIKYEDIKKSRVFINFSNFVKFLGEYEKQSKNILSILVRLRSFHVNLVQTKEEIRMHKQIYSQNPHHFQITKKLMMQNFYVQHIKNAPRDTQRLIDEVIDGKDGLKKDFQRKKEKKEPINRDSTAQQLVPILSLGFENVDVQFTQNRFSLTIGQIKARQISCKEKILDIKNVSLTKLALEKFSEKQEKIVNVGNEINFRIVSIYANATVKTAEKILMLYTLINDKLTDDSSQQESSNDSFVSNFLSKKVKADQIFNNQNQSMHLLIQTITLVTPAFDKDRIFHINLNKFQCDYPSVGTKTVSLERIELKRTTFQNLKNQNWKKLGENESIILENDRSFTILISQSSSQKVDPKYFNFVKNYTSQVKEENHARKIEPMIEHEGRSCFNLIIPFLFVQLACEDIYYLMLMKKFWQQLMNNPYVFKPKLKTKEALDEVNKTDQYKNSTFHFIKQIQKNTKLLYQMHIILNGLEFIFNGDKGISQEDDYLGKNRICTLMIDSISYDSESRLKDDTTKIKVKNFYLRNMLGNDEFNIEGLEDVFKEYMERKEPLIHRKNDQYLQNSFLIMYNHYMEDFQTEDKVPAVDIHISNSMNIDKLKGNNDISVVVKAFEIFHEPKFFRCLLEIFNKLDLISGKHYQQSRGKFFQKSFIRQNNQFREFQMEQQYLTQNKEILYSKDFTIINSMNIQLQKVNLIVLLQSQPIYCIALDKVSVKHKTESYITVYNIKINELYIMDVGVTNGPHSMIFESNIPINANFTQYNCELLKERYKRSALMKIQINRPVIHFLNKKVMQLLNFINQLNQDLFGKPDTSETKAEKQNKGEYPFCYQIIVVDSSVILYRNSLSKEKLTGKLSTLTVTNYKSKNSEQIIKKKTNNAFNRKSQDPFYDTPLKKDEHEGRNYNEDSPNDDLVNETQYEEMSQLSQNRFKSFLEESVQQETIDYIYIDIYSFSLDGRHRQKEIVFADKIHMSFHDIYFKIFIPQMNLCMDNDDFRLLIRITEENFGEQDRYFHINPVFKTQKYEKFVTEFHIVVTKLECINGDFGIYQGESIETAAKKPRQNQNQTNQSMNILTLIDLRGKDVAFINGQKYDQVQIQKIYAETEDMNRFIEKYNRYPNDPIIEVKPKTIAHSQKYFSKLSEIFDIFSKIGQQGQLVLSDFDYKQEEVLNRPDRGKIIQFKDEQQANWQKLMKWLRGMCDKCFWWAKKKAHQVDPSQIAKALIQKETQRRKEKKRNMIQEHTLFCNGDYNMSHIFSDKEMIRLQKKVSPETFYPLYDPKYPNQIYFRMDMETTKDKKMYILAKDLIMTYEPNKGLLDLMGFFTKPYGAYQDYDPPFVASNFNNFRPAQMYMELKDSRFEMKKENIGLDSRDFQKIMSTQKIVVFLDLIYNMQTMGDMIKGPGRSIKEADIILQLFHSVNKEGNQQYIELSNLIEMIYRNQANVSYKKKEMNKFDEKIILKPYFDKEKSVNFYVPAFSIKALMDIVKSNSQEAKKRQEAENKSQKQMKIESKEQKSQKSLKQNKNHSKGPKLQQLASKIDQKKQRIKQKDVQSSTTDRKVYMESLCINVESKLRTSFIKFYINNFMFTNIYENMIRTEKNKMELNSQLSIDYWNLHLLQFQPVLEPWNSKLIIKNIKRENTLSKKIKLQSFNRALDVEEFTAQKNKNWLNLNLSCAFFHTYKELELKYLQAKDEKEEDCIDATSPQLHGLLKLNFEESQSRISKVFKQSTKKDNFPEVMKNFFGRRFILQSQAIKKKGQNRQNYFHQLGTVYNLYHSFFDRQKRKKIICYRTPFRILNCFSDHINLKIKIKHKSSTVENPKFISLQYPLRKGEFLTLPALIYKLDFLLSFQYTHKHQELAYFLVNGITQKQKLSKSQSAGTPKMLQRQKMQGLNETKVQGESGQEEDNFISAQYLMQIHSQKSEFRKDKNSRILRRLFSQDVKKDRYLDSRDILIESGKRVFALICTKSEYDNDKERSKMRFYDTLLAIVSPIQIYNYCPMYLTVILNGKKEYKLDMNKSTFIAQDLNVGNIHETVIEFREHILHREFTFLKKENENHTYFMEIDRMQSVNVRVVKETTSTFSIQIYADWIVENLTDQEFELEYMTRVFPIDNKSKNCLAIENYNHGKKIEFQLSMYSPDDSPQFPYQIVTNATQVIQIVTLYKKVQDSEKQKLLQLKKNLKIKTRCCFNVYPFREQTKQKQTNQIYKVYSFLLKIAQYQQCKLTKTMSIRYKTKMKNKTNKILTLFQYSREFKVEKLYPDNEICIWGYDFLPEYFLIDKKDMISAVNDNFDQQQKKIQNLSQPFRFDQSMGKLVTIRFKQSPSRVSNQLQYYKNYSYLKMEIIQHDHSSLYEFTQVDINSSDQFPIYIHNTTDQTIKIYENNQSFFVKPRCKVPFSWSNLVDNSHQIDVEISDVKKTYSFKQNQQFEPIIIKDENARKPIIHQPKTNFHKEICRIKYGLIEGKFETIIDIKQNSLIILPGLQGIEYKIDMKKAVKMTTSAQSIELNLGPKQQPLIIYPSNQSYQTWLSYLNYTINQDIVTKVSFTIETYKKSRLFFFHNVQLGRENDYLTSSENYFIENLYISVINEKPQQVILLYLGEINLTKEDRVCRLGYEDYQIQKCDRKLQVKEIKINNQLDNAVNPVILTQIKKSKTPFISIITKKRNLVRSEQDLQVFEFKDELITHFESFRFFLDEAQAMIEASLIPKLLSLKNQVQKVQSQYKIEQKQQEQHDAQQRQKNNRQNKEQIAKASQQQSTQSSYQLYLSFLEIRPIKMTVSVSFDKLSKDEDQERMNIEMFNLLPVGIENAIITIDSYMFHHIYEDRDQVLKQIKEFYKSQLTKQVLINAGNLEFLVAIDLVKNLGIGVKNIFYDPIYEFASNKDIKNTTSTFVEGLFSFVLFIISFFVKIVNLVFKILAIATFDTDYKAKRQIFRKQIFKSPLDGVVYGGKYFWKIFKSFKEDFVTFPKEYYQRYSIFGCIFGVMLGILNFVPWMFKIFITFYDWFCVICIGFLSWGHYEENAMKNRSRPIRVFHKKKLVPYNLLQAKAYEIMRKHNITLTQKQSILYVRDVDSAEKTSSYLILSDYSLLYCNNRLSIFDEIILYKVFQFKVKYPQKKSDKNNKQVCLEISLKSPNIKKFIFIEMTKYNYLIKFKCYEELLELLQKLRDLKEKSEHKMNQKYDYSIIDDKKAYNEEEIKKMKKRLQPLEYKEMDYLQNQEVDNSQSAIIDEHQIQIKRNKKKQIAV